MTEKKDFIEMNDNLRGDLEGKPRHAVRATRNSGKTTRSAIIESATKLFRDKGISSTSVNEIATDANVFPSQISYYFGTKESLFIEVACNEILTAATMVEKSGKQTSTPKEFVHAIVETAENSSELLMFIEAMILTKKHPENATLIGKVFRRLHKEGERAVREMMQKHDWELRTTPDVEARAYWVAMLGIALEKAVMGENFESKNAEAVASLVLNLHRTE